MFFFFSSKRIAVAQLQKYVWIYDDDDDGLEKVWKYIRSSW